MRSCRLVYLLQVRPNEPLLTPSGVLLFNCNGRGIDFHDETSGEGTAFDDGFRAFERSICDGGVRPTGVGHAQHTKVLSM